MTASSPSRRSRTALLLGRASAVMLSAAIIPAAQAQETHATGAHVASSHQLNQGGAAPSRPADPIAVSEVGRIPSSSLSVAGAQSAAAAHGNSSASTSGSGSNAGVANSQYNGAAAFVATAALAGMRGDGPTPSDLADSALNVAGNGRSANAVGNSAANALTLNSGDGEPWSPPAMPLIDGSEPGVLPSAAVLNAQINNGPVVALNAGAIYGLALNHPSASIVRSGVAVSGNTISATAAGNIAESRIDLASPDRSATGAVLSLQTSYGPVFATIIGGGFGISTGPVRASSLTVTGNQIAATAVGNQATNTLSLVR